MVCAAKVGGPGRVGSQADWRSGKHVFYFFLETLPRWHHWCWRWTAVVWYLLPCWCAAVVTRSLVCRREARIYTGFADCLVYGSLLADLLASASFCLLCLRSVCSILSVVVDTVGSVAAGSSPEPGG